MNTYHIRDLKWTREFLSIPGSHKRYSLHHVYISPDAHDGAAFEEVETDAKQVVLKHHRTHEIICRILVDSGELNDYRAFENQLLDARLP